MTLQRSDWNDLSQAVRDLVQARTGPVLAARTVSGGLNSHLAAVLETIDGSLFVKGVRTDHPGVVRQHREAMINPHVLSLAPPLLWQAEGAGWTCWRSPISLEQGTPFTRWAQQVCRLLSRSSTGCRSPLPQLASEAC